jgi:hypothetical protein
VRIKSKTDGSMRRAALNPVTVTLPFFYIRSYEYFSLLVFCI